ncbi:MAG: hypothetical protein GY804_11515 [Alphaproteobacteria bacterium]|nr:hypothetical protein [Alphaproteobacteria bacterium]
MSSYSKPIMVRFKKFSPAIRGISYETKVNALQALGIDYDESSTLTPLQAWLKKVCMVNNLSYEQGTVNEMIFNEIFGKDNDDNNNGNEDLRHFYMLIGDIYQLAHERLKNAGSKE